MNKAIPPAQLSRPMHLEIAPGDILGDINAGRVVRRSSATAAYVTFQMAEAAVLRQMFTEIPT
jgi:hypothetical protein